MGHEEVTTCGQEKRKEKRVREGKAAVGLSLDVIPLSRTFLRHNVFS